MSRRQSRVSIDVRHNDTLLEFENYKKKFLLANKHITKLNSTLSVRIEELNAQISVLHVENLRLRASEIALASQLKKEREKSRKILAEAEAATQHFMKHLGYIRKSHNVPHSTPNSPERQPPALRARRPVINPDASPPMGRIAKAPTIPGIDEEDEDSASSPESPGDLDDDGPPTSPTPSVRNKSKPRSSGSRLPLPTRASSPPLPPPPPEIPNLDLQDPVLRAGKRKPTRRQSGLLTTSLSITTITEVLPPRSSSPVGFASTHRREGALEEEEEVLAVIGGIDGGEDVEPTLIAQSIARREKRKKSKDRDSVLERDPEMVVAESSRKERRKSREGEPQRSSLDGGSSRKSRLKDVTNSPPSSSPLPPLDTNVVDDRDCDAPTSATSATTTSTFASTRTFLTTPATTPAPSIKSSSEPPYLPTPRSSSPPPPPEPSDLDPPAGGRERRVRKSVNYAEPKLNTKMRKPDPPPSTSKRSSMSASEKARVSLESQTATSSSSNSNSAAEDVPPLVPPYINTATSVATAIGSKRRKSRAHTVPEEEGDSDGAEADAEFGGLRTGWVNVEGRRRSTQGSRSSMRYEGDDGRRHSIAV